MMRGVISLFVVQETKGSASKNWCGDLLYTQSPGNTARIINDFFHIQNKFKAVLFEIFLKSVAANNNSNNNSC